MLDFGIPFHSNAISEAATVNDLVDLFPYVDISWRPSDINVKVFNDGITNKLVGCFRTTPVAAEGPDEKSAAVVRIFGKSTDKFLDRERELAIQVLLSKVELAPPVYVRFPNGVCYGFINGRTLSVDTVKDPKISKLISEKLAAYHTLSLGDLISENNEVFNSALGLSKAEPYLWRGFNLFLNIAEKECSSSLAANNSFPIVFGSLQAIRDEVAGLKDHIVKFSESIGKDPAVNFCHNDLLLNNILYDANRDQVSFIDFEYADFNYAAFDIANHFVEYAGVDDADYNRYPSKEYQLRWINNYLAKRHSLLKLEPPNESDVKLWYVFVQKFALAAYILWATWALVQNQFSDLDF